MRPWYREPMLWLVITLPAVVVVAAVLTLAIAIGAGGSDSVPDSVRRTAQIQTADLRADLAAQSLGLRATLERDRDTGALAVALHAPAVQATPPRLRLHLGHPTDAAADRELVLVRAGQRWLGRLPDAAARHDWRLQLAPEDASWRLRGRLVAGAAGAALVPEFAAP